MRAKSSKQRYLALCIKLYMATSKKLPVAHHHYATVRFLQLAKRAEMIDWLIYFPVTKRRPLRFLCTTSFLFAVCSKPPSRDNHRTCKLPYPRTQQRNQGRVEPRSCDHGRRKNDTFTILATLPSSRIKICFVVLTTTKKSVNFLITRYVNSR